MLVWSNETAEQRYIIRQTNQCLETFPLKQNNTNKKQKQNAVFSDKKGHVYKNKQPPIKKKKRKKKGRKPKH